VTHQAAFDSISYGSRYQAEMEAAEVMSLSEGSLIVFSRGLRHIAQDSRKAVFAWLRRMPAAPKGPAANAVEPKIGEEVGSQKEAHTFW